MSKHMRDRLRIWTVGVSENNARFSPTSREWFRTRKECQQYIDQFRRKNPGLYKYVQHKPMCYLPAGFK